MDCFLIAIRRRRRPTGSRFFCHVGRLVAERIEFSSEAVRQRWLVSEVASWRQETIGKISFWSFTDNSVTIVPYRVIVIPTMVWRHTDVSIPTLVVRIRGAIAWWCDTGRRDFNCGKFDVEGGWRCKSLQWLVASDVSSNSLLRLRDVIVTPAVLDNWLRLFDADARPRCVWQLIYFCRWSETNQLTDELF